MSTVNEVSLAEFARYRNVSKALVTKWKKSNRLIMTVDGKRVRVKESDQKLIDTEKQNGFINRIHAEKKRNKKINQVDVDEFTDLKKNVNETQLDLETKNAKELFENSRALREKAVALRESAEYEKFIGELCKREDVEKFIFVRGRQFRGGLVGLARRMPPMLIGKTDVNEIERILADEFREILIGFSKLPMPE